MTHKGSGYRQPIRMMRRPEVLKVGSDSAPATRARSGVPFAPARSCGGCWRRAARASPVGCSRRDALDGVRVQQAGRRQAVCLDAWHVGHSSTAAGRLGHRTSSGAPGRAPGHGHSAAQRSGMQRIQPQRLKRAGHAKAVAARAETVAQPVPRGENAPGGARRSWRGAGESPRSRPS